MVKIETVHDSTRIIFLKKKIHVNIDFIYIHCDINSMTNFYCHVIPIIRQLLIKVLLIIFNVKEFEFEFEFDDNYNKVEKY